MGVQYLVRELISCRLLGRSQTKGKKKAFFIFYSVISSFDHKHMFYCLSRIIWMCEREMGEYSFVYLKKCSILNET